MDSIYDQYTTSEYLKVVFTSFNKNTNIYSVAMIFESFEAMEKYEQVQKQKYLAAYKPHLIAGPVFKEVGEVRFFHANSTD